MENQKHYLTPYLLTILLIVILLPTPADTKSDRQVALLEKQSLGDFEIAEPTVKEVETVANCRYGITTDYNTDQYKLVDDFGAGWYLDFLFDSEPAENGAEYVGIIYVQQDKDEHGNYLPTVTIIPELTNSSLGGVIDRNPGRLWIIGNEVDRGPGPKTGGVGDTYPQVYARAYHDAYHFIKQRDPTALVGVAGLVEVTPGRLSYLDQVWDSYLANYGSPMPVDVWNMHIYILPEVSPSGEPNDIANVALGTDPALGKRESGGFKDQCPLDEVYCLAEHDDINVFEEQVIAMRTWMRDHGQRQKPLILSEYSILYPYYKANGEILRDEYGDPFDPQRARNFMAASFEYLDEQAFDEELGYSIDNDRLVQQWLWFSVYRDTLGNNSNLITDDNPPELTPAGELFKNTTHFSTTMSVNLLPGVPPLAYGSAIGGVGSARISVPIYNNGTANAGVPIEVAFYSDSKLSDLLGTAVVPGQADGFPGMTGCGVRSIVASVVWGDLTVGEHTYWVKVDYQNVIDETDENDNIITGTVKIIPATIMLPIIYR